MGLLDSVLSQTTREQMTKLPRKPVLCEVTMLGLLKERLRDLGSQQRKWPLAVMAVPAHHAETEFPVIKLLIRDDARVFDGDGVACENVGAGSPVCSMLCTQSSIRAATSTELLKGQGA